jgi:hypothetical protein
VFVAVGLDPIVICAAPPTATILKVSDCTENADDVVAAVPVNENEEPAPTGLCVIILIIHLLIIYYFINS